MRRKIIFSILLVMGSLFSFANRDIVLDPDAFDYDYIPSYCVSITDTLEITLPNSWMSDPSIVKQEWVIKGAIQYVDGYNENSFPLVKIYSPTDGFAKGRITYKYKTTGCSSFRSMDFFKHFTLPDSIEIEGPECIIPGQVVVYSVTPLLTANLNDQIGMDFYEWNVLQEKQPFVDSILYVSGDGSSVTFRVSENTNNATITAQIGQCNSGQVLSKSLGNATPPPQFASDTLYMPYGETSIDISLVNPSSSVDYYWSCDKPSFIVETNDIGNKGTQARITATSSAVGTDCEIIVEGEFTNITCNTSQKSVVIRRTWGNAINTHISASCVSVGSVITCSVSGEIPSDSHCKWVLPTGWEFVSTDTTMQSVRLRPNNTAHTLDSIQVEPLNINDTASARYILVSVQPSAIAAIHVPSCLEIDEINTCWIDTIALKPSASSYIWSLNAGQIVSGQGTDTIYFIPSRYTNTLSVTPIGERDCNGITTTLALPTPPITPDSITSDNECLFAGNNDEFTLTLHSSVSGQHYGWVLPTGWNPIYNADSTSVTLTSTGARGVYDVYAWAIGSEACGVSDSIHYEIKVDTVEWYIEYEDEEDEEQYKFVLFKNGIKNPTSPKLRAIWYVNGDQMNTNPVTNIAVDYFSVGLPQEVKATINLDGCDVDIYWHNVYSLSQHRRVSPPSIGMIVHPNPAQDIVRIKLLDTNDGELVVYDITGEILAKDIIKGPQKDIDVSSLPNGVYNFVVRNKDGRISSKVIIRR